jgi:glycosyltransferase involved in cell wall biosynthesis
MAFIPYFVVGPTSVIGLIGLIHGPDQTIPTPTDDWKNASFDLIIPSYNEEKTIVLCLASLRRQTVQPKNITLYDDGSQDNTVEYAKNYAALYNMNLKVIQRNKQSGKTVSIFEAAHESDADALGILDADTLLRSETYWEAVIKSLFQGIGIAAACGTVLPLTEQDRINEYQISHMETFAKQYPKVQYSPDQTAFQRFQRGLSNQYREELYLFLQRYIYHGEMIALGTLIFPIGCAVVYRREYLKSILDYYYKIFGYDLTDSEDIFLGFAFAHQGYKNVQVADVYTLTMDPRFQNIYQQIFKWSSSFLQCCYYFDSLFFTPFKSLKLFIKNLHNQHDENLKKIIEKRKIKEAYRQPFGVNYTEQYGRNIGWFIFTTAIEKMSFPVILLILMILKLWFIIGITVALETLFYTIVIAILNKNHKIRNFIKSILFTPIRYSQIMFELIVIGKFTCDLWITKNRRWRK